MSRRARKLHQPTLRRRGTDPRDQRSFDASQHPRLRRATSDLSWFLERGYPEKAALELVGNRYQLLERQRRAVGRCAASTIASASAASFFCRLMKGFT